MHFSFFFLIFRTIFCSAEYFLRKEPSGRLPYELVPNILKHFGISLKENELTSAAQDLQYNSKINIKKKLFHQNTLIIILS